MTKEQIEQRIADLRKQLDQLQANGNAIFGAIQECELWLSKLQEKDK